MVLIAASGVFAFERRPLLLKAKYFCFYLSDNPDSSSVIFTSNTLLRSPHHVSFQKLTLKKKDLLNLLLELCSNGSARTPSVMQELVRITSSPSATDPQRKGSGVHVRRGAHARWCMCDRWTDDSWSAPAAFQWHRVYQSCCFRGRGCVSHNNQAES